MDTLELARECGAADIVLSFDGPPVGVSFTLAEFAEFESRIRADEREKAAKPRRGRAYAIAAMFFVSIPIMSAFGPAVPWYYWIIWVLSVGALWNPVRSWIACTSAIRSGEKS
jgi:hypothetical protein